MSWNTKLSPLLSYFSAEKKLQGLLFSFSALFTYLSFWLLQKKRHCSRSVLNTGALHTNTEEHRSSQPGCTFPWVLPAFGSHSSSRTAFQTAIHCHTTSSLLLALQKSPSLLLHAQCGRVSRCEGEFLIFWVCYVSNLCIILDKLRPCCWNAACRQMVRAGAHNPSKDDCRMGS